MQRTVAPYWRGVCEESGGSMIDARTSAKTARNQTATVTTVFMTVSDQGLTSAVLGPEPFGEGWTGGGGSGTRGPDGTGVGAACGIGGVLACLASSMISWASRISSPNRS